MTISKQNKPYIIAGILVGVAAIVYFLTKKPTETPLQVENSATDQNEPVAPTINKNLVVKLGSKGLEVKELQKLMSIKADGIFGPVTEARLIKLKNVKSASINSYKNLPTLNQNVLPIGTKLMAIKQGGLKAFAVDKRADGVYYIPDRTDTYDYDYGDFVGTIVGVNGTGSYYLTTYVNIWEWDNKKQMVLASEVKKIN